MNAADLDPGQLWESRKPIYSHAEACAILSVSERQLRRLRQRGTIKSSGLTGFVQFSRRELERYMTTPHNYGQQ